MNFNIEIFRNNLKKYNKRCCLYLLFYYENTLPYHRRLVIYRYDIIFFQIHLFLTFSYSPINYILALLQMPSRQHPLSTKWQLLRPQCCQKSIAVFLLNINTGARPHRPCCYLKLFMHFYAFNIMFNWNVSNDLLYLINFIWIFLMFWWTYLHLTSIFIPSKIYIITKSLY